jgi:hypothetical protein
MYNRGQGQGSVRVSVMIAAEDIQRIYYEVMAEPDFLSTSGKPFDQQAQMLKAWDQVLAAVRKGYEEENERLRVENRDLKQLIADMMEADAKPRQAIGGGS